MWIRVPRLSSTQSLTIFHLAINYRIQRVTQKVDVYWSLAWTYMLCLSRFRFHLITNVLTIYGQNSMINPWDQQNCN